LEKYKMMKKLLLIFISLPIFISAQNSYTIQQGFPNWSPANLTINVGDTVTWISQQANYHSLNATQDSFPNNPEGFSYPYSSGWAFEWVFTVPGTYQYDCAQHWTENGVITVIPANEPTTYVPDDNFEDYIESFFGGNGIANDDLVFTSNISAETHVNVNWKNISDLTGIEDFTALTNLSCVSNQITNLDLSANTNLVSLICQINQISSLDLSANTNLVTLQCFDNQLTSLDVRNGNNTNMSFISSYFGTGNPNLFCVNVDDPIYSTNNWTDIDSWNNFSSNCLTAFGCLDTIACNYDSIAAIDDGSCTYPTGLQQVFQICDGDSVTIGNNVYNTDGNYTDIFTAVNGCDSIVNTDILIDYNTLSYDTLSVTESIVWNGMPLNISGDYSVTLMNSVGCDSIVNLNLTVTTTGILDIANNKNNLVKITDMLGQETPYRKNTPLFYIFDDGTVEKRIVIE